MTELIIDVHADPGVWFAGPHDPTEGETWAAAAIEAVATDLALPEDDPARQYLLEVFTAFAVTDVGTPLRFLRLRGLGDPPLVVRVDVALHDQEAGDPLLTYDDNLPWYDHGPTIVELEAGLRRAVRLYADDGLRAVVRHHRLVLDGRVDVLLSCTGFDMMSVGSALLDLDILAASIEITEGDAA